MVKGNQASLQTGIAQLFAPPTQPQLDRVGFQAPLPLEISEAKTVDKAHGRLEIRELKVRAELNEYARWPGLAQVFEIKREWYRRGKWHQESHLGITSLPTDLLRPL